VVEDRWDPPAVATEMAPATTAVAVVEGDVADVEAVGEDA